MSAEAPSFQPHFQCRCAPRISTNRTCGDSVSERRAAPCQPHRVLSFHNSGRQILCLCSRIRFCIRGPLSRMQGTGSWPTPRDLYYVRGPTSDLILHRRNKLFSHFARYIFQVKVGIPDLPRINFPCKFEPPNNFLPKAARRTTLKSIDL